MADQIPQEIFDAIVAAARIDWHDDAQMLRHEIESERSAYIALRQLDFGLASAVRPRFVADKLAECETWSCRLDEAKDEVRAAREISEFAPADMPEDVLLKIKKQNLDTDDSFDNKLSAIKSDIEEFRFAQRARERYSPFKNLLLRMEAIVGSEFYNENIQNYSSWGEWDGEGRAFRYPVTMKQSGQVVKVKTIHSAVPVEDLVRGYYKVGANELSIFRALSKIVELLQAEYGLSDQPDALRAQLRARLTEDSR